MKVEEIIRQEKIVREKIWALEQQQTDLQRELPDGFIAFYNSAHEHKAYINFRGTKKQLIDWLKKVNESYDLKIKFNEKE